MTRLADLLRPLRRRVLLMVGRGIVRLIEEGTEHQALQLELLDGEVRGNMPRFQEFGLASRPLPGSRAVAVFIGGNRGHGIVLAVDDPAHRPTDMEPGETVIYDAHGKQIRLLEDGTFRFIGGVKLRVEGDLEVTGNVTDQVEAGGISMLAMRTAYNAHGHTPSATSPPAPPMGGV